MRAEYSHGLLTPPGEVVLISLAGSVSLFSGPLGKNLRLRHPGPTQTRTLRSRTARQAYDHLLIFSCPLVSVWYAREGGGYYPPSRVDASRTTAFSFLSSPLRGEGGEAVSPKAGHGERSVRPLPAWRGRSRATSFSSLRGRA